MYSFGKLPPRDLQVFGVAGILGDKCKIYYKSIFTTRHIGRVTDLLSAQLGKGGPDELKLRAVLLFSAFEAHRSQTRGSDILKEPLVIECGIDSEKVAIGISFLSPEMAGTAGLADRISKSAPSSEFEKLLLALDQNSDRLVLKAEPKSKRVEIVSLLAIPGKVDPASVERREPLEVVSVDLSRDATGLAASYVELGDLDYPTLLKEDQPGKSAAPSKNGEYLVRALAEQVETSTIIKGGPGETSNSVRISNVTEKIDQAITRVSGESESESSETIRISGGLAQDQVEEYEERIRELQERVNELELQAIKSPDSAPDLSSQTGGARVSGAIKDILRRVWPFNRNPDPVSEPVQESAPEESEPISESPREESVKKESPSNAPPLEVVAKNLMLEIQAGSLDRTIGRVKREAQELSGELTSKRAKRWVNGLISDLVTEKARLQESAKKLNVSVRQKELEFRNKEMAMQEELRRRDELLRQKSHALMRAKDQLSQVSGTLDKMKAGGQAAADDQIYRSKYNLAQKMLGAAKDENTSLNKRVEELKKQLNAAHMTAKNRGPSFADFSALQSRYERTLKQVDELKKQNQQLVDRVADAKKDRSATNEELTKKRLEAAMQAVTQSKRESERFQARVGDLQTENSRLKMELERTQIQLKAVSAKKPQAA